jgi:hypothetical protein
MLDDQQPWLAGGGDDDVHPAVRITGNKVQRLSVAVRLPRPHNLAMNVQLTSGIHLTR